MVGEEAPGTNQRPRIVIAKRRRCSCNDYTRQASLMQLGTDCMKHISGARSFRYAGPTSVDGADGGGGGW